VRLLVTSLVLGLLIYLLSLGGFWFFILSLTSLSVFGLTAPGLWDWWQRLNRCDCLSCRQRRLRLLYRPRGSSSLSAAIRGRARRLYGWLAARAARIIWQETTGPATSERSKSRGGSTSGASRRTAGRMRTR
jgi:hypothetical protein